MIYMFMRYPGWKAKAVTLSYDDGCSEDVRLADRLTRAGIKCTFNLNCADVHGKTVTKEEVEEHFLKNGHEIAVHGFCHRAPGKVRPIEGIRDVLDCRLELERTYGFIIRGMAYPDSGIRRLLNGVTYENIRNYLKDLGIVYCRTLGSDNNLFALPEDWYAWMPNLHHTNPKTMEYIDEFLALDLSVNTYRASRDSKLLYIWGHGFEFKNNWELLDEICEKLGGHEDIWYATNMEIYEYVNAYNSLVYSADGRTIYNPTLFELYFDIDGVEYKIASGETLKI